MTMGSNALMADTPAPPYYAVIFTSIRTEGDNGYSAVADRMVELASRQPGFLGIESAREEAGITISYWTDIDSIGKWKNNVEHVAAQDTGKEKWYASFTVRIAKVESDYSFER